MGRVKLTAPRIGYSSERSESPQDALDRALAEVRAERHSRDKWLLRTGRTVRRAWTRRPLRPSPAPG